MLQLPKNVMQIGKVDPHMKIYMEDYVHTFLERQKKGEQYLAFGKKEERGGVFYFLIYGVEKKVDWDRGSYPYFKKYERIGTIEGPAGQRIFKPVRGAGILLDGYFIFYEQNEDMQSYMIVVREMEDANRGEEKEEVLEAVRAHREQHKKELEETLENRPAVRENAVQTGRAESSAAGGRTTDARKVGGILRSMQKKERKNAAAASGKRESGTSYGRQIRQADKRNKISSLRQGASSFSKQDISGTGQKNGRIWGIPELCRAGSLVLLLILLVMGLTSVNRYSDMRAVMNLFSDAWSAVRGKEEEPAAAGAEGNSLIVEEATAGQEETTGLEESQEVTEAVMNEDGDDGELLLAQEDGKVQWMIGQTETEAGTLTESGADPTGGQPSGEGTSANEGGQENEGSGDNDASANAETASEEEQQEEATQAIARPVTYVVKKGDSLLEIARKFYGNTSMVKEICSLNDIEDPNQIQPGQNILLP